MAVQASSAVAGPGLPVTSLAPDAAPVASNEAGRDLGASTDGGLDAGAGLTANDTITRHHGACFGDCQESTLKLTGAGVLTSGGKRRTVEAHATEELFALARATFDAAPRCPAMPTDLQRTTLTLVHAGKMRSAVHLRHGACSKTMTVLERRLEQLDERH